VGVEYRSGRQKSLFSAIIRLRRVLSTVIQTAALDRGKLVTLIADIIMRRRLLLTGDDEMFMTRSLNVTPKTTEQYLIVYNGKSQAAITNNKRLRSS